MNRRGSFCFPVGLPGDEVQRWCLKYRFMLLPGGGDSSDPTLPPAPAEALPIRIQGRPGRPDFKFGRRRRFVFTHRIDTPGRATECFKPAAAALDGPAARLSLTQIHNRLNTAIDFRAAGV